MKTISFKKKVLATAIGSYALAGFSGVAVAQGGDPMIAEEVVVTGIRGSLMRAMDIKRDSQGVVDAISAEDIGKFPDTNLAESLQRITGVSIDRSNGEGSKVTVRGFGPDYNLVTLNGRQMPGATIEATSASGSRSFDFSNLAAESVSAVEVFKTVRAENPVGGLGATINIKTARPLDNPGLNFSAGVKGVWDESAEDPSLTPEISGIYSQTFADDKFGVGLSLIYQDREGGNANAQIGTGWRVFPKGDMWGAINNFDDPSAHINPPGDGDIYGVPQQIGYNFNQYERQRVNGQLVLQFAPTDDVTATLDYTYSRKEATTVFSDTGAWFNFGAREGVWTDNGVGVVESPLIYREVNLWNDAENRGADLTFGSGRSATLNENTSIGLNVAWSVNDRLTLEFDAHQSDAESKPDSEYGNNNVLTTSAFVRESAAAYMGEGDLPVMWLDITDGAGGTQLRKEDLQITGSSFRNSQMLHEIDQFQVKGNFEIDDSMDLDFGVSHIAQSNRSTYANNQRDTWSGLGSAGDIPEDAYTLTDISSYFDNVSGHNSEFLFDQRFIADFDQIVQYAATNLDDGGGFAQCSNGGTYYCANQTPDDIRYIEEDSTSAWVQINVEREVAGIPARLAAGVRYEDTTTKGFGTDLASQFVSGDGAVVWVGANELYLVANPNPNLDLIQQGEGSYDYFLPSIDLSFDLTDDVVARASYGRSLGRPLWNQLSGLTVSRLINPAQGDPNAATGAANRGNVALKPMVSDNFDLSVEWYYSDASYVSVGYYRKDVENFIGTQVTPDDTILNAPNPSAGARRDAAIAASVDQWNAAAVKDWIVANATDGVDPDSTPPRVYGLADEDPNVKFNVTEYVNQEKAKFDGFEFAVQHNFGETGFGVVANYTIADSDTEYNDFLVDVPQFALTGLSDTANLVAFYDKDGIQVRLSYNWRDEFLNATADGTGANPSYTEAYQQFDLNASYDVTDELTVFFEGVNITDEYSRTHARSEIMATGVFTSGPRYAVGARYTF